MSVVLYGLAHLRRRKTNILGAPSRYTPLKTCGSPADNPPAVTPTSSLVEALDALTRERFHVVLVDGRLMLKQTTDVSSMIGVAKQLPTVLMYEDISPSEELTALLHKVSDSGARIGAVLHRNG